MHAGGRVTAHGIWQPKLHSPLNPCCDGLAGHEQQRISENGRSVVWALYYSAKLCGSCRIIETTTA